MEGDDRRVRIVFERPDYLHLVPPNKRLSGIQDDIAKQVTDSDRTRAAVEVVLDRCTSFTASLVSSTLFGSLGRHSQTLPQFPKPI